MYLTFLYNKKKHPATCQRTHILLHVIEKKAPLRNSNPPNELPIQLENQE
jgi:hypothetical protein